MVFIPSDAVASSRGLCFGKDAVGKIDPAYLRELRIALGFDPETGEQIYCTLCNRRLDNGEPLWGGICHQSCRDAGRLKAALFTHD